MLEKLSWNIKGQNIFSLNSNEPELKENSQNTYLIGDNPLKSYDKVYPRS